MGLPEKLREQARYWSGGGTESRGVADNYRDAADEVERLTLENWQLKGALGYPVPGDVPQGKFRCGLCAARKALDENVETPFDFDMNAPMTDFSKRRG